MSKYTLRGSRALKVLLPLALISGLLVGLAVALALPDGPSKAELDPVEALRAQIAGSEMTPAEAVLPEDVLSEEEIERPAEFRGWDATGEKAPVISADSSAGAIPAVKPFNFGRDPGGPEDKTLYLTLPELELEDVPVFDTLSEEKLKEGTIHVPATGFPWQEGANVYIAGHRVGYPDTESRYLFYDLDALDPGDDIMLEDADSGEYTYRVTEQFIVGPNDVEVMEVVEDRSVITLQSCTLPDYAERLVIRGELVEDTA